MNETTNNGGSAFPVYDHHADGRPFLAEAGMTLRDYFAAKAMQGFVSSYGEGCITSPLLDIAEDAYEIADAMLKARGQQ